MSWRPAGFDILARPYKLLEFVAFGRDLEMARFMFLPALRQCKRVLLLGDGDGRLLSRLMRESPNVRVDSVDLSPRMLQQAKSRLSADDLKRVRFRNEDALTAEYAPDSYDGVVTAFFLDCFTEDEVQALVRRLKSSMKPNAVWLHIDFALPPRGWRRVRARVWMAGLYLFFRATTGISARALPRSDETLASFGLLPVAAHERQARMIRSVLYRLGGAARIQQPMAECDD